MSEIFILIYFHTNNPNKVQYQLFLFVCLFVYTAGSYQSSILYTSVYTCQSQSPNSAPHHPHPTAVFALGCPYVCSLHLYLNYVGLLLFFLIFKFYFIFFYTAGSYQSSVSYTSVYTCQSQSPNSSHHHPHPPTAFPPWCPYIYSLHLCLNCCPANWFIYTIFLGSTYIR